MRMMALALVAALAGPGLAEDHAKTLRIGVEGAYPPFNDKKADGTLAGFDIDIARALCARLKVTCVFVAETWDNLIPALRSGRFDAVVSSLSITDGRKKLVAFTQPYYRQPAAFIARKDAGITATTPAALKGHRIGAVAGGIHAHYLKNVHPEARLITFKTLDDAFKALKAGDIDLLLADRIVLHDFLRGEAETCCALVGEDVSDPAWFGEGAGIAVRLEDGPLRKRLNAALEAIIADGTHAKISRRHLPFPVYRPHTDMHNEPPTAPRPHPTPK